MESAALPGTGSRQRHAGPGRPGRPGRGALLPLVLGCYVAGSVYLTWRLWQAPSSRIVAGNPTDADLFAWFFRFEANSLAHGRFPALVTSALNAPTGVNLMWNTSMLLPGIVLAPLTMLSGPQASLTVLMTAGFAGSAASMLYVLRKWGVGTGPAALAGGIYGFSPALVHSSIGHYDLQFAVFAPLIADAAVRLATGRSTPVRGGVRLGLLATAQLFTGEELLAQSALAGLLLLVGLALARPRAVARRIRPAAGGLSVAVVVLAAVAAYGLWIQFAGPLTQHGSAFLPDFFKNDLTGFVTPSRLMALHTGASAAAAAAFPGGAPEYLAYLGWPLLVLLVLAAAAFWREPAVRATALAFAVLEVLSLGGHPLIGGTVRRGVTLPWHWLQGVPLIGLALPDRFSLLADGAAAALLGFALDAVLRRARAPRRAGLAVAASALAVLPLLPLPLPATTAAPLPEGWTAVLTRLRLPAGARVLAVPVPTPTLTAPMRWQAESGARISLIGGYFQGPAWNGHAYVGGNGPRPTAVYLDRLWAGGQKAAPPAASQVRADLAYWRPVAVVAVTGRHSVIARYLTGLFGPPAVAAGRVLGWRTGSGASR